MSTSIIVSRHPAAIQFIRDAAGLPETTPVVAHATAEDVTGRVVYGNLPMHLAACTSMVVAVEFAGDPPRGSEYTIEDMYKAGAHLASYNVTKVEEAHI